jgi:ubiquinone/menaquinone biosynthesis C-methylase UbiE
MGKKVESEHKASQLSGYAEKFSAFLQEKGFKGQVLVINCDSGDACHILAKTFPVLGIDANALLIMEAKDKYPQLEFAVQRADRLLLESGSIGAVALIDIGQKYDLGQAIREVERVLAPEGYFSIYFCLETLNKEGKRVFSGSSKDLFDLIGNFKAATEMKSPWHFDPDGNNHRILELILKKSATFAEKSFA